VGSEISSNVLALSASKFIRRHYGHFQTRFLGKYLNAAQGKGEPSHLPLTNYNNITAFPDNNTMSHQEAASMAPFSAAGPPFFPAVNDSRAKPAAVAPVNAPAVRPAAPKGHYYNKRGVLKKCNPPTK
jgi:hypothetical protein